MKSFTYLLLSLTCLFIFTACDSHSWEDTYDADGNLVPGSKRLFEAHGYHGSHDSHGDKHGKSDSHDESANHDDHHKTEGH